MRNTIACLFLSLALLSSCKKETKVEETTTQEPKQTHYSVDASTTEVGWTAYKTTAKTPVSGKFVQLKLENPVSSETKQGAFSGLAFEIPVSSFFSANEERDTKIKELFFGVMKETTLISGSFSNIIGNEEEGTMTLKLKMNGEVVPVETTYKIERNKVTINGTLTNLMDWKMDDAFNSLHKACELLHTGEDGVSRTWEDVAINAVAVLKESK